MNVVNIMIDFEGVIADANASTLKGGAIVQSPHHLVNIDAYIAYGVPKNMLSRTPNNATVTMTVEDTSITSVLDEAVSFIALPAVYSGNEIRFDWIPNVENLLTKVPEKSTHNSDTYIAQNEGTDKGVTMIAGCTADGIAWVFEWDPTIIVELPE
jgi:hypothetical protein